MNLVREDDDDDDNNDTTNQRQHYSIEWLALTCDP